MKLNQGVGLIVRGEVHIWEAVREGNENNMDFSSESHLHAPPIVDWHVFVRLRLYLNVRAILSFS